MIEKEKLINLIRFISENKEVIHEIADAICDVIDKHRTKQTEQVALSDATVQSASEKVEENTAEEDITAEVKKEQKQTKKRKAINFSGARVRYDAKCKLTIQNAADLAMASGGLTQEDIIAYVAKYTGIPVSYFSYRDHIDFRNYKFSNKRVVERRRCVIAKCLQKLNLPINYIKALSGIYVDKSDIYKTWSSCNSVSMKDIKNVYNEFKLYLDNFNEANPGVLDLSKIQTEKNQNIEKIEQQDNIQEEVHEVKENKQPVLVNWLNPVNIFNVVCPRPVEPSEPKVIIEDEISEKEIEPVIVTEEKVSQKKKRNVTFTLDMVTYDLVLKMVNAYDQVSHNFHDYSDASIRRILGKNDIPKMQMWIARAILFGHKYIDKEYSSIPCPVYWPSRELNNIYVIRFINKIKWLRSHGKTLENICELLKSEYDEKELNRIPKIYYEGLYSGCYSVDMNDELIYKHRYLNQGE